MNYLDLINLKIQVNRLVYAAQYIAEYYERQQIDEEQSK